MLWKLQSVINVIILFVTDPVEDFPVVKSRASKLRETKSQESGIKQDNDEPNAAGPETEEPFQVLQSARQFAVPELDDEAFLESLSKLCPPSTEVLSCKSFL